MTPASAGSPKGQDPERGLIAEGDNIAVGAADAPSPCLTTPNPILEGVELREAYARVREALEALAFEVRCNREPLAGPLHQAIARADEALQATLLIGLSQGEGAIDAAVFLMLDALHANVPTEQRPMGPSDLSDDQMTRARNAVRVVQAALSGLSLPGRDADARELLAKVGDIATVRVRRMEDYSGEHREWEADVTGVIVALARPISGDAS